MENGVVSWTFGGKDTVNKILKAAFKSYWPLFIFYAIFCYFLYLKESNNGESYAFTAFVIFGSVCLFTLLFGAGNNSPIFYLVRDKLYKKHSFFLSDEGLRIESNDKNIFYKFDEFESFDWQGDPRDYLFYKVLGVKFWLDCKVVKRIFFRSQKVILVYATLDNYQDVRKFLESKLNKKPIQNQKSFVLWSRNKSN